MLPPTFLQPILLICGVRICESARLLKFICRPNQAETRALAGVWEPVQARGKCRLPLQVPVCAEQGDVLPSWPSCHAVNKGALQPVRCRVFACSVGSFSVDSPQAQC